MKRVMNFKPEPLPKNDSKSSRFQKFKEIGYIKLLSLLSQVIIFVLLSNYIYNKDLQHWFLNFSKYICLVVSILVNINVLALSTVKLKYMNLPLVILLPVLGIFIFPAVICIIPFVVFFLINNGGIKGASAILASKAIEFSIK